MSERKYSSLTTWRSHPEDYLIIQNTRKNSSGQETVSYLITNLVEKMDHLIEDDKIATVLALEMIAAGVRVVSPDEARRIRHPNRFPPG